VDVNARGMAALLRVMIICAHARMPQSQGESEKEDADAYENEEDASAHGNDVAQRLLAARPQTWVSVGARSGASRRSSAARMRMQTECNAGQMQKRRAIAVACHDGPRCG
jgi:hypothetical protein